MYAAEAQTELSSTALSSSCAVLSCLLDACQSDAGRGRVHNLQHRGKNALSSRLSSAQTDTNTEPHAHRVLTRTRAAKEYSSTVLYSNEHTGLG